MYSDLDKIIEAIGPELAAKLCHELAGQQIYIYMPSANRTVKKGSPFQAVIDCIGVEAAQQLQIKVSGNVYVPKFKVELAQQRHQEIIDNYQGERVADYAAKVGMSEVWLRKIFSENGVKTPERPTKVNRGKQLASLWQGEGPTEFSRKHNCSRHVAREAIRHAKANRPEGKEQSQNKLSNILI